MGRTNRTHKDRGALSRLADRIKDRRIKAGLTQEQAAKKAKRRQSTWAGWESGSGDISFLTLKTIAEAIGTDLRELVA